jgi:DNA (cytosine-5)-methyltransferase 1
MRYGSVCSGIEAASVAWEPLGWEPAFFSEIEKFPARVLKTRFPEVKVYGDFTKIQADAGPVDLLVGGTPCQSFSIAGKRLGLDDPRGNLALEFLSLVRRLDARWFVWENVPGALSSRSEDGSSDFATFLGYIQQLGYGFAWRVLDAQYVRVDGYPRAVPQRRRRLFVVGHRGDWRRAAAVLFEPQGLRGDPAPRRQAGKGTSHSVAPSLVSSGRGVERAGHTRGQDPVVSVAFGGNRTSGPIDVAAALLAKDSPHGRMDFGSETFLAQVAGTLTATGGTSRKHGYGMGQQEYENGYAIPVAHALRGEGFDASEDGSGRGAPLVPVAFRTAGDGAVYEEGDKAAPLTTGTDPSANIIAFDMRGREGGAMPEGPHDTANIRAASGGSSRFYVAFTANDYGGDALEDLSPTLRSGGSDKSHANGGVMPAIAIQERAISENVAAGPDGVGIRSDGAAYTLEARTVPQAVAFAQNTRDEVRLVGGDGGGVGALAAEPGMKQQSYVAQTMAVRRLTPVECERLQGFPDGWTDIGDGRGGPTPDGPRYKALGNSMAINVMRWIGMRIDIADKIFRRLDNA